MKTVFAFYFLAIANIGLMAQVNDSNRNVKSIPLVNKVQISSLNGKPISFYLNHPRIDKGSKSFYKGKLGVSRDSIPSSIMDSLLTGNSETRPFYFFIFNQIVNWSSGRVVDAVAPKCLEFVEKHPCEFFNSFNQPEVNINVVKWTTYIGMTLKDKSRYADFKGLIDPEFKANCSDVQDLLKSFLSEVRMCLVR